MSCLLLIDELCVHGKVIFAETQAEDSSLQMNEVTASLECLGALLKVRCVDGLSDTVRVPKSSASSLAQSTTSG